MELTGTQRQAVAAIVNRAVERAASALAETVGHGCALSVPVIDLVPRGVAAARVGGDAEARPVVAVRQPFRGCMVGEALLVFREANSLELIRTVLADTIPLDIMTDLEHDALTEVGNVVLNACLSGMASQLDGGLTSALPRYQRGPAATLLGPDAGDTALALDLEIAFGEKTVGGFLIFLMNDESAAAFLECVDKYLQKA